ncbi:hypothetical protein OG921_26165 [Aldersonia sp. NBC_00410]|uniref:hypothetical protein n=1 Tax=Aldersonia sp. NBC_00410 TaxID=2975954 RepID=UPI00225AFA32|nr:hypothetical protein [Aldersonia sp. NBC_00410]MCX5046664.1 hypothetical protein [Aldersonia sp. NBC_00410]
MSNQNEQGGPQHGGPQQPEQHAGPQHGGPQQPEPAHPAPGGDGGHHIGGIQLPEVVGIPDLGDILNSPGESDYSSHTIQVGVGADTASEVGGGVEVSISAPGGVPELSVEGDGHFLSQGQFEAEAGYQDVEAQTDNPTADEPGTPQDGSMTLSVEQDQGGVSGYGGVYGSGDFNLDISPVDGGIPEVGVGGHGTLGDFGGIDAGFAHQDVQIDHDGSADGAW